MGLLKKILANPALPDIEIDSPQYPEIARSIIRNKPFLKKLYSEWYEEIATRALPADGPVLEIGTGGGFLRELIPQLITSELFYLPGVRLVLNGTGLPFREGSIWRIILVNVFHHIPEPELFLAEAGRCLCPGGRIIMIEPWVTPWSRFVYTKLHHEPFEPETPHWSFAAGGPLTGANGALPWILFHRDRDRFIKRFPALSIREIRPTMPCSYLLSGGISMRSFLPGWGYAMWRTFEKLFDFAVDRTAMFAIIDIRREKTADDRP